LSVLATSFGEFEPGQELALECLKTARSLGRPDFIARSLGVLAWATNCLGDYEASEAYWRESLAICQSIDDKRGIARALNFLGWETWSQAGDRLVTSRAYHEEAIALLRKLGSKAHLVMALADFGLVTNELDDFETTAACCAEGMAMAQRADMPTYVAYNQTCLGVAEAALGQVEQGIEQVRQAIRVHFETEQTPQCLLSLYYLMLLFARYPSQLTRLNLSEKRFREIATFVAQHPFNYHPIRDRARILQEDLAASSSAKALEPDSKLSLESVVTSVLSATSHGSAG
jgi:tetratricopeptide (TPR) repeat protein